MNSNEIPFISCLNYSQKSALKKAGLENVLDVLLLSPSDLGKRCKITLFEAQHILDAICNALGQEPILLETICHQGAEKFTTGDCDLDSALGGGIRTGMIWDIAGESSAGKTQLALQLSLTVQLPLEKGGLSGSVCYLTTTSWLQTNRLVELMNCHPLLNSELCSLSNIQAQSTGTIEKLLYVLSTGLSDYIRLCKEQPDKKPVKLLVIDALAELFRRTSDSSSKFLYERSQQLTEISTLLHSLASKHGVAVVVLTEVVDSFNRQFSPAPDASGDLTYSYLSRFFNQADSIPGENTKEATMGLVWANQVNVRIFMSRTGRRRYLDDTTIRSIKARKATDKQPESSSATLSNTGLSSSHHGEDQPILIRRLSVIFSSVAVPVSVDYIITPAGLSVIGTDEAQVCKDVSHSAKPIHNPPSPQPHVPVDVSSAPTNIGSSLDGIVIDQALDDFDLGGQQDEEDEWDTFWKEDSISEDAYLSIDFDTSEATTNS